MLGTILEYWTLRVLATLMYKNVYYTFFTIFRQTVWNLNILTEMSFEMSDRLD